MARQIRRITSKRVVLMPWVSGTTISTICHAVEQDDAALALYQTTRDRKVEVIVTTRGRHPRIEVSA